MMFGTGVVIVLAFIVIIALFFIFSAMTPMFVGKCVAVVDINQELAVDGVSPSLFDSGTPGSEQIASSISALDARDDVGAVLIVFNSPGGSVVATREIYSSVKELKKPKVSYFRETAASGAYYIATGTDYIISDPDAITGSIGVIATFTEMSGLLEKLGVNITAIKSGPHKDIGSPYRNMTGEENVILQAMIDEIYQEFRGVVIANRGQRLNTAQFNEVSDGRILSGRQALKAGLVDQVGSKKDALMKAAQLGGIEANNPSDVRVCPIQISSAEGGLFSAEGFVRSFESAASGIKISFN